MRLTTEGAIPFEQDRGTLHISPGRQLSRVAVSHRSYQLGTPQLLSYPGCGREALFAQYTHKVIDERALRQQS